MQRHPLTQLIKSALLVAGASVAAPLAAQAQSHPLVGTWSVELVAGQRVENGSVTPIVATGSLVIVSQGDSLIGTLTMEPIEGSPPRPPARLAGKRVEGTMTFVSRTDGTMEMNGEARTIQAISTWVLTATGDAIEGTVAREVVGVSLPAMRPQPVKGTRTR